MYYPPPATPPTDEEQKREATVLQIRAHRRHMHAMRCSFQAIAAKANLIVQGKGANGRSMSPALLKHHMDLR